MKNISISIEHILREVSDYKKRFLFSTNCLFVIELYFKQQQYHFFVRHFELLLQANESIFGLLEKIMEQYDAKPCTLSNENDEKINQIEQLMVLGYLIQMIKNLSDFRIKELNKNNKFQYSKQHSKCFVLSMVLLKQFENLLCKLPQFAIRIRHSFDHLIKKIDLEPYKSIFKKKIPFGRDSPSKNK